MAKAQYVGVNGVARKVKQPYIGVNGITRTVTSSYVGVNGVARQFFELKRGDPISSLYVGDAVYLNINGTMTEFWVVQQGRPTYVDGSSEAQGEGLDGTWLLMKDCCAKGTYSQTGTYLRDTLPPQFDQDIQDIMVARDGTNKLFLLTYNDLGFAEVDDGTNNALFNNNQDPLEFFNGVYGDISITGSEYSCRKAFYNGVATAWWTDSTTGDGKVCHVSADGGCGYTYNGGRYNTEGIRPALILPKDTPVVFDGSLMGYFVV